MCRQLIAAGADVNATSNNGWSPLHYAVARGDIAVAKVGICFLTPKHLSVSTCGYTKNVNLFLLLSIPYCELYVRETAFSLKKKLYKKCEIPGNNHFTISLLMLKP